MFLRALFTACLLLSGAFANTVTGVVTFEGHPVAGIEVHVLGIENGDAFGVTTKDDGSFTISGLPEWKQLFLVVLLPSLMAQTNHAFTHHGDSEPMIINLDLARPMTSAYADEDAPGAALAEASPVTTEPAVIVYAAKPDTQDSSLRQQLQ